MAVVNATPYLPSSIAHIPAAAGISKRSFKVSVAPPSLKPTASPAVAPVAVITRAYTFLGSLETIPSAVIILLSQPFGLCAINSPCYKLSELLLDDELLELLELELLELELFELELLDEELEELELLDELDELDEYELELLDDELLELELDDLELLDELELDEELDEDELELELEELELENVNTCSDCRLYNAR